MPAMSQFLRSHRLKEQLDRNESDLQSTLADDRTLDTPRSNAPRLAGVKKSQTLFN